MAYLLVRTKVKDFEKWKALFNKHTPARRQSGSKGGHFFRNVNDPSETIFLLEWDNLANAKSFAESAGPVLQEAGLLDQPNVYFLDEVYRPSA
jgi:hypothetical protein